MCYAIVACCRHLFICLPRNQSLYFASPPNLLFIHLVQVEVYLPLALIVAGHPSLTNEIFACPSQSDWFSGWTCAPGVLEVSVIFLNLQII